MAASEVALVRAGACVGCRAVLIAIGLEGVFEGNTASPGDGKADNFDSDALIATGELQGLIPDLIEALGGEMPLA